MTVTMGVDLGIKKVAWAVWEDDILVETGAFDSLRVYRPEQLKECARYMYHTARSHEPDHIWVEDTLIGNNRKYSIQLSQMMGAVLADLFGLSPKISTVNNKTWKREVLNNGNATKESVRDYIYSVDSAYAVLCGHDQDRFDAACIGYYGYLISRRAEALADPG